MAAGDFNLAAASDILKEQYDDHEAYKILVADDPFLGMLKREEGVLVGKNFKFAIQYGTGRGVATTLAKARAGKSTNPYTDVELHRGRLYGVGGIDRETMETAKSNKAAFVNGIDAEQDGLLHTMNERLIDWAYKNGGGAIGVIGATTVVGTAILVLSDAADAQNFQVDGIYELSATDGTSGAIETGSLTCVAVDRQAGTVTMSGNLTAGVATAAVGQYVFPAGDHATHYADSYGKRVAVGLDGWLPITAPGATPFFGIDRSKDPLRLGGCRYNGRGAPMEETLIKGLAEFSMQGATKIDTVLTSESRVASLIVSLGNRCRFDTKVNPVTKVGFKGVEVVTSNGTVTVFGTPHCKSDRGYALQLNTWRLLTMNKCPKFIDEDGLTIRRSRDGGDGFEWEMVGYLQFACNMPGKNGVFQW